MTSDPALDTIPFPIKPVRAAIAAMVLCLVASTFLTWRMGQQIREVMKSQIEVLTTAERVSHYGDVLELSIKAVVTNGDEAAAARYRNTQPQLRQALVELRREIRLPENRLTVQAVDRADLALVAMEYEALDLASKGRFAEARRVVYSSQYDNLLKVYFGGIEAIERRAEKHVSDSERMFERYLWIIIGLSLAGFGIVLIGWFVLVRPPRRWGEQLQNARRVAEEATRQLQDKQAELETLNRKFFDQARIDPLTKLQTRLKYNEDIRQLWPKAQRYSEGYCAIMCDVDCFKQYNDSYGHLAGDSVLREVADAMTGACRAGDQIYRYGGEEFLLILRAASAEEAMTAAERYRAAVEALAIPHRGSPHGFVSVSMGVAQLVPGQTPTVECWVAAADEALYEAKRTGRNRVALSSKVPA
jgi:diguanylate cyclase (GGDEF)-like protein